MRNGATNDLTAHCFKLCPRSMAFITTVMEPLTLIVLLTLNTDFSDANNSCPNKEAPKGEELDGTTLQWTEEEPDPDLESKSIINLPNDPKLITFFYYKDDLNAETIIFDQPKTLKLVKGIPLKVLTHGFLSSADSEFPLEVKEGLFKYQQKMGVKANVIVVDWGPLAGKFPTQYGAAVKNTQVVGKEIARLLIYLHKAKIFNKYSDVHLLGFSLGAHTSGVAGHQVFLQTKEKVGRITGFDPAGPSFGVKQTDKTLKLDKEDAILVDVIHSNAGVLGTEEQSGHIDIYPNGGGATQPGCVLPPCSHAVAHKLFTASLTDVKKFIACKCEPWNWNKKGECKETCTDGITVGILVPMKATGNYYLKTAKFS